ncbi:MAG: hypothetical protein FWE37_07265 [Spirochaetaceae bacterium]|nr:hypothetical protein [Spirochaetaceae bacterium]
MEFKKTGLILMAGILFILVSSIFIITMVVLSGFISQAMNTQIDRELGVTAQLLAAEMELHLETEAAGPESLINWAEQIYLTGIMGYGFINIIDNTGALVYTPAQTNMGRLIWDVIPPVHSDFVRQVIERRHSASFISISATTGLTSRMIIEPVPLNGLPPYTIMLVLDEAIITQDIRAIQIIMISTTATSLIFIALIITVIFGIMVAKVKSSVNK